jgi:nitroreductase/FMN reductase [NAD(P)H]
MPMPDELAAALELRFGSTVDVPAELAANEALTRLAGRRSHRRFAAREVAPGLLRTLLACALSAPSKSDLQQACVVQVEDWAAREAIADLVPSMPWLGEAPVLLVFCGDNRRIRRICELRGKPFANDHLDSFFNAAVDAGIVLASFVNAAEAAGLGCCPVSVIRNHAARVAELLALPAHVFPVAGMVAGYPAEAVSISPRLPLEVSVHVDAYDDARLPELVDAYDRRRAAVKPIARKSQRRTERYGVVADYGWSEDKARQVSVPERADFGEFVRRQGFRLD